MKSLRTLAATTLLCASVGLLAAQDDARPRPTAPTMSNLPADIFAGIFVEDITATRQRWADSRIMAAWESPGLAEFRAIIEDLDGTSPDDENDFAQMLEEYMIPEFMEHFTGFISFFGTDISMRDMGGFEYQHMDACFVAAITPDDHEGLQEKIELILDKHLPEDARRSVEDYRDIPVYRIDFTIPWTVQQAYDTVEGNAPFTIQFAMLDDALIIGEGQSDPVRKLINTILDEDADRLPSNASFRFAGERLNGADDVVAYFDIPRFFDFYEEYGKAGVGDMDAESAHRFFEAIEMLGLRNLGALSFGAGIHADRMETRTLLQMPRDRQGIISMLYSGSPTNVETATIVPADVDYYTSFTMDLGPILQNIRQLVVANAPQGMMMYDMWKSSFSENFGVDIEADFLNNISGEHAVWTRRKDEEPEHPWEPNTDIFAAIGVTNGSQVILSLNQLFHRLSDETFGLPITSSEQNGFRIWAADPEMGAVMGPMASDVAVGLTDRYLVISGSQAATRDIVRRVATGTPEGSLAEDAQFQASLARVPRGNLRSFSYNTPESMANALNRTVGGIAGMWAMSADAAGPELAEMAMAIEEAMPEEDYWAQYFGPALSTSALDARALDLRYIITFVEE